MSDLKLINEDERLKEHFTNATAALGWFVGCMKSFAQSEHCKDLLCRLINKDETQKHLVFHQIIAQQAIQQFTCKMADMNGSFDEAAQELLAEKLAKGASSCLTSCFSILDKQLQILENQ